MNYEFCKKGVFNSFVLFLMIFMSKKMNTIVATYFPDKLAWMFSDKILLTIVFSLLLLMIVVNTLIELQLKFSLFFSILLLMISMDIIFVANVYKSYLFSVMGNLTIQISTNFSLLGVLLLLTVFFQKEKHKITGWYKTPLMFIIVQSLVGIAQFLTKSALFTNSNEIIGNSYYINGVSNANSDVISYGGFFRASGLTNSSLTLGMFMLFGIVLTYYLKHKKLRMFLICIFSLTIFMTVTRIIWIAWLILIIFLYLPKFRHAYTSQFMISVIFWIIQVILPSMQQLASSFGNSSFFSTMFSRFKGYSTFTNLFPIEGINIVSGQNFVTRIAEYSDLPYSLDNQYLVLIFNLGLIGYLVYIAVNVTVTKRLFQGDYRSIKIGKLLLVLPVIGITNDPSYFVNGILLIAILNIMDLEGRRKNFESNIYSDN